MLGVLMAGCAAPPPAPPPPLRLPGAPIYSLAGFDTARLQGNWTQVATFTPGGQVACGPGGASFADGQAIWALCLAGGPVQGSGPVGAAVPGRLALPGMADWWVLWVDADDRTALIGTPGGGFGFVLSRGGPLPADRLQAVRDIATFNGYRAGDLAVF
jgi:apolipoprotein D and lipocalin family protein